MNGIKIETSLINSKQTKNQKNKLKKKLKKEKEKFKNEKEKEKEINLESSDFSHNNELYSGQTSIKSQNYAIDQFKRKTRSYSYAFQENSGPYMYRYLSLHNYMCETEEIISYNIKPANVNLQNRKQKLEKEQLKVKKTATKEK